MIQVRGRVTFMKFIQQCVHFITSAESYRSRSLYFEKKEKQLVKGYRTAAISTAPKKMDDQIESYGER